MEKELLSKLNAFDTHDNIMVSILAGTELEVDISETGRDKIFAYAMRDSAGVVKRIMLCTDNFKKSGGNSRLLVAEMKVRL